MLGYTETQARAAHKTVDRYAERALAALANLETAISDTTVRLEQARTEVQEMARVLHQTIDHRTARCKQDGYCTLPHGHSGQHSANAR